MTKRRNAVFTGRKPRSNRGFTLIELLVVVIIIGILAAIALPNFVGAQDKAREASVKANMRTAQIAAESYAVDNGGTYPPDVDADYKYRFPGGDASTKKMPSQAFINPFTNAGEFPIKGTLPASNVQDTRNAAPSSVSGATAGQVVYCPIFPSSGGSTTNAEAYAIMGAGKSGIALPGNSGKSTLVLSNQ